MPTKNHKKSPAEVWAHLSGEMRKCAPHLAAWYTDNSDFTELRLKARDDGTILAIAKGFGPDGGKVVCFGTGYGVEAALLAINLTIQGGHWRKDKPWKPDEVKD